LHRGSSELVKELVYLLCESSDRVMDLSTVSASPRGKIKGESISSIRRSMIGCFN